MRLSVDVLGDRNLLDRLDLIRARVQDPRVALNLVADDFLETERRRFAGGANWAPLSPTYAADKLRRGRSTRPLVDGPLERSLTVRRSPGSLRRITKEGMRVGTRLPVARLHQGSKEQPRHPGGVLPRRPLVDISSADAERWRRIVAASLTRAGVFRIGL